MGLFKIGFVSLLFGVFGHTPNVQLRVTINIVAENVLEIPALNSSQTYA